MTKTDLLSEISGMAYEIEDIKEEIKRATDSEKRKKLNEALEYAKKQYIILRAMLESGEYAEDEEYEDQVSRWQMAEENARIAEVYASCSGSY